MLNATQWHRKVVEVGGGGRDHWKDAKWFSSQIRFMPKA